MLQILGRVKRRLDVSLAMKIIVLMAWCIWTTRNDYWIFNNAHPTVQDCKLKKVPH
jgi:hypothetical protein